MESEIFFSTIKIGRILMNVKICADRGSLCRQDIHLYYL